LERNDTTTDDKPTKRTRRKKPSVKTHPSARKPPTRKNQKETRLQELFREVLCVTLGERDSGGDDELVSWNWDGKSGCFETGSAGESRRIKDGVLVRVGLGVKVVETKAHATARETSTQLR
jgi:hypothetical protein